MRVARRTILLLLVATGAAIAAFLSGTPLALAAGIACSPSQSTLTVDHTSVPADGAWDATITATCLDGGGVPLAGRTVVLVQSGGSSTINPTTAVTDANGVATFMVADATPEGPITYSAADQATFVLWNQTVQVTFVYCDTTIVPEAAIGGGSLAVLLGGGLFFWQFRRRRRLATQSRS